MLEQLIRDAEAARTSAQSQHVATEQAITESHAAIRHAIENGETTGNVIQDALLFRCGHIDPTICAQYEAINSSLKGKAGQLILLSFDKSICTKHTFTGVGNEYQVVRMGVVGVLLGDSLVRRGVSKRAWLGIPVTAALLLDRSVHKIAEHMLAEESHGLDWLTFVADDGIGHTPVYHLEGYCAPNVRIHAGNDEVLAYVEECRFARGSLSVDAVLHASLTLGLQVSLTERIRKAYENSVALDRARLTGLRREAAYIHATLSDLRCARQEKQPFLLLDRQTVLDASDVEKLARAEKELVRRLDDINTEVASVFGRDGKNVGLRLAYFRDHPVIYWGRNLLASLELARASAELKR